MKRSPPSSTDSPVGFFRPLQTDMKTMDDACSVSLIKIPMREAVGVRQQLSILIDRWMLREKPIFAPTTDARHIDTASKPFSELLLALAVSLVLL